MKTRIILYIVIGIFIMIYLGRKIVPRYLERMALAIMNFEGYYDGTRSFRNNNPGNLKFANQKGAIGKDDQNHAIFETFADGWNALIAQLKIAFENRSQYYNSKMSLYEFFRTYAEGNQRQYAEYVAGELGVIPDATLDQIKGLA